MAGRKFQEVLGGLSRRERQIMEIVYARDGATSLEVHQLMPNPPSYSAVRAQMRILTEKGFLKHERVGLKYLFHPTIAVADARESALSRVVQSFFDNSLVSVVASLLNSKELEITDSELKQLKTLIAQKRESKKRSS